MKESARAARDEIAHNRCVAALKALAGEGNAKVAELEDLRTRRLSAPVSSMMEREIMADVLEDLHKVQVVSNFTAALERTRVSAQHTEEASPEETEGPPLLLADVLDEDLVKTLRDNRYVDAVQIVAAKDEDLLDIKGIGPAKLKEIREAVG